MLIFVTANNVGQLLVYPTEYLSIRMSADIGKGLLQYKFKNVSDCVKKSYKQGGWKIFFTGCSQKLQFNLLYPLIAFFTYLGLNKLQ